MDQFPPLPPVQGSSNSGLQGQSADVPSLRLLIPSRFAPAANDFEGVHTEETRTTLRDVLAQEDAGGATQIVIRGVKKDDVVKTLLDMLRSLEFPSGGRPMLDEEELHVAFLFSAAAAEALGENFHTELKAKLHANPCELRVTDVLVGTGVDEQLVLICGGFIEAFVNPLPWLCDFLLKDDTIDKFAIDSCIESAAAAAAADFIQAAQRDACEASGQQRQEARDILPGRQQSAVQPAEKKNSERNGKEREVDGPSYSSSSSSSSSKGKVEHATPKYAAADPRPKNSRPTPPPAGVDPGVNNSRPGPYGKNKVPNGRGRGNSELCEWLRALDGGQGQLLIYLTALEENMETVEELAEVERDLPQFFEDLNVTREDHQDLIQNWFIVRFAGQYE